MAGEELSEMQWILGQLNNAPDIFLIEEIVDLGKDYCVADVHGWGRSVECRGVYGKIRDLVTVRAYTAVRMEKLDRASLAGILEPYEDKVKDEAVRNVVTIEEIESRLGRVMEGI